MGIIHFDECRVLELFQEVASPSPADRNPTFPPARSGAILNRSVDHSIRIHPRNKKSPNTKCFKNVIIAVRI
jgi:hypothetical protein